MFKATVKTCDTIAGTNRNIMSTDTDPYANYAHGEWIYDQIGIMNHWEKMHYLTNSIDEISSLE